MMKSITQFSAGALALGLFVAMAPVAQAATNGTHTVNISVPARLSIVMDNLAGTLTVDPDAADGTASSLASGLTVFSNYKGGAKVSVTATAPQGAGTAAGSSIPLSNFKYRVDSSNTAVTFSDTTATSVKDLNTKTGKNGAHVNVTYLLGNSFDYDAGDYTSTVTYTVAAP
ncbi:hypothetical protein J7643_09235 [bacterium]|nr:hypothetical protein [bacterium]